MGWQLPDGITPVTDCLCPRMKKPLHGPKFYPRGRYLILSEASLMRRSNTCSTSCSPRSYTYYIIFIRWNVGFCQVCWGHNRSISVSQEIFDQGIFEGKPLAPGFAAPVPEGMDHHLYSMHIEKSLPEETPGMFGMPANAETGYLTNAAEEIFAAFSRWALRYRERDREPKVPHCYLVLKIQTATWRSVSIACMRDIPDGSALFAAPPIPNK